MTGEMDGLGELLIQKLNLEPLENEGGYFRRTYVSKDNIESGYLSSRYPDGQNRSICSAIYYLITPNSFSHLHRLTSDEIFHFYWGDPVDMWQISPEGFVSQLTIGPNPLIGQHPQILVPAGHWQASRLAPGGNFALLGTTMAPAFQWTDFEKPRDLKEMQDLCPVECHRLLEGLI